MTNRRIEVPEAVARAVERLNDDSPGVRRSFGFACGKLALAAHTGSFVPEHEAAGLQWVAWPADAIPGLPRLVILYRVDGETVRIIGVKLAA